MTLFERKRCQQGLKSFAFTKQDSVVISPRFSLHRLQKQKFARGKVHLWQEVVVDAKSFGRNFSASCSQWR